MMADEMTVGTRVRLVRDLHIFQIGSFPEGATGTVVAAGEHATHPDSPAAEVKMDDHFADLEEWENVLHVFTEESESTPDYFERIVEG